MAGGASFQAEVFAWWATRAVAGCGPGFGLDPDARIDAVGCESGLAVDDIGVSMSDGGLIVVQAKGGMRRLDQRARDLREAVDQLVRAMTDGLAAGVISRPVEPERDRLIIATNQDGSRSFHALGKVCDRLRGHPLSLPPNLAATDETQRMALRTFLEIVRVSWAAIAGREPDETEVRRFLHVVEICRLDIGSDDGIDRQRCEEMLRNSGARRPFSALTTAGMEASRQRKWLPRHELMLAAGVSPGARGDARSRLMELTAGTLNRLSVHRLMSAPEGRIRVRRHIVDMLHGQAGSFVITGSPGAGKSGVMADLADCLPGDKVVLAVDAVNADRVLAHLSWQLDADIAEILRAWDGPEPATLMLDGLDAHRSGPSWLVDLVAEVRGTRWRVIASIRQFDLDHSRQWQNLFHGIALFPADRNSPSRIQVRHAAIPSFDELELAQIVSVSPSLASVLAAGDKRLRDLLGNPFNMSIAAELVAQVGIRELAAMSTQVQILAAYWQARVNDGPGAYERGVAVRDLVEQMTKARSLEVIPKSASGAMEELVRRGVLEEAGSNRLVRLARPIRFRHHIVFDFALAAAFLGEPGTRLADVLADDPDFVLFGRPAIDFHLADLWLADEDRSGFWDPVLTLAERSSPLALAAGAAVAVRQAGSLADLRHLICAAAASSDSGTTVVNHLAGALSAVGRTSVAVNIAAWDGLIGALGDTWLAAGEPRTLQAMLRLIWELDALQPLPRPGGAPQAHAGTIVSMLEIALSDPAQNRWLADRVLRFITGALTLDSRALPLLRQCLNDTVTAVWGLLPLRPVLEKLGDVARADGQTAALLAAAPFLFDASDDLEVPVGPSQIVALREKWSQAHASLRFIIAENSWAALEAASPRWAMEALVAILKPLASTDAHRVPVSWNAVVGGIDSSGWLLDLRAGDHIGDLVTLTVAAMASRAASGHGNETVLRIWAACITHPDAWSNLLQAAADEPSLAVELRSSLLETSGLFFCAGTRSAAIKLAATLSPLLDASEHARLEQVVTGLPDEEPELRRRRFLDHARDEILTALDRTRIQTTTAAERLKQIYQVGQLPGSGQADPFTVAAGMPGRDRWLLRGLDPAAVPASAMTALASIEAALADGAIEPDRWQALATAVTVERELDSEADAKTYLRYRIGRLITLLLDSERMTPQNPAGEWAGYLLLALSDGSALRLAPEDLC